MATITISTDQGTTERTFTNQTANDVYNCTGATFRQNFPEPNYPLSIDGGPADVEIYGGTTLGLLDPAVRHRAKTTVEGVDGWYLVGNGAAVFGRGGPNFHIHDWTFGSQTSNTNVWDAIRLGGSSKTHLIEDCVVWQCFDDAVESDTATGGTLTVQDCLFTNCYAGISATNAQTGRTINLTRLLLRITDKFPNSGPTNFRGGPMFKVDSVAAADMPTWVVNDCVFAYDGVPQETARSQRAFSKWSGTGNTLCFIRSPHTGQGGTKPGSFPAIPAGMTVLEDGASGSTALDFWNAAQANYLGSTGAGAYSLHACSIDPTTGIMSTVRTRAFPANTVTVRATNVAGSNTDTVSVEVA